MKKHFLKSFALIAMLFSALTLSAASGVDWSTYAFLGDGAGGGKYTDKYKVSASEGLSVVNIQVPGFTQEPSIYATVPAGISDCNVSNTIQGAGIALHLSAFTAQETQVIINYAGGSCTFWVYYADGTEGGEGGGEPEPTPDPEDPEVTDKWADVDWVAASDNKYKIYSECLTQVVSVQQPGWANEKGIYVTVPAGISECSVNGAIDGAGMILYLSSFTAKETEVTITHALGSCTFWVYYADGTASETPGEGGGDGLIVTEYCDYTDANLTKNGAAIALTWETADNGDVVITMSNGVGAESCAFRNGGFEGGIDAFVVSTDNFETTTPASNYFTFTKVYGGNEARLVKIADLQKGAKIKHVGEGHALAWKVNDTDQYCFPDFIYTYGGVCNKLDAPINVAVTEAGVITFDEVIGANAYEVRVYQGATLKYTQEIISGGIINFEAYVDGEYIVKVIAKGEGKGDSSESDPVSWNVKASPLPMSNYCETLADAITANNGYCSPLFSWITDAAGNVVITVSASEGDEGATTFRGTGMNGAFSLDGSEDNFKAYFDKAKTDDYTYTLTLKDAANKPLLGAVISFSGQIEAKSSINGNDWSNYVFNGYLYGTNCTIEDNVKPVMGTATLLSNSYDVAIVEVSATDNIEVAKYRVVDENNGYNKSFKPADGKITVTDLTPSTKYTLTITALDLADNESENSVTVEVTTEAHNYKPTVAPAAPTVAEKKVISVYSDAYAATNNFTAHEGWGDATIYQELDLEGNKVRYYTNLNYLGWQHTNGPINALNMEKLHLDIWAELDGSLKVTPIYGGEGLTTDDSKGKVVELKGQQWNSIDFELTEFVGFDWSSIFQFKFDLPVGGTTFAIDNVYFYRETEIADTEAPTDVVATLKSASYTSVVITCQAADNSGTVSFDIFDGENKVATNGAESGKPVDVTVAGLEAGKTYNLSVVAYDINENKAAAVTVEAATLALPAPAPVPTKEDKDVLSIYSNTYTPAWTTLQSFNEGWWAAPAMAELEVAEGDKVLYYYGFTTGMIGWQFGEFDATGYTTFSMDIYPLADGTIDCGPLAVGEGNDYAQAGISVKGNEWNTITIDLTGKDLTKIYQVKMINYYALQAFFVDNVYLYKAPSTDPTGVENNMLDNRSMKLIENGRLVIIRNGVTYDVTGRVVR